MGVLFGDIQIQRSIDRHTGRTCDYNGDLTIKTTVPGRAVRRNIAMMAIIAKRVIRSNQARKDDGQIYMDEAFCLAGGPARRFFRARRSSGGQARRLNVDKKFPPRRALPYPMPEPTEVVILLEIAAGFR